RVGTGPLPRPGTGPLPRVAPSGPPGAGQAERPGPAAHPRRPPKRRQAMLFGRPRSTVIRMGVMLAAVLVMIIAALTGIGPSEPSVTASVKNFLVAWETGNYAAAASMTSGPPVVVARTMRDAYSQLGAQGLSLSMGRITVHGDAAVARFNASIDLGRGGRPWNYQGRFDLRRQSEGWLVQWSPSVIVPGLGPGERLAVLTTVPGRAPLLDSGGHPLILKSQSVEVGVRPDRVADPAVTASRLAKVTGLASSEAAQMVGQILAAPPNQFLELIQLAPRKFAHLSAALGRVPGLTHRVVIKRLFRSTVPAITGAIGTEAAKELIKDGDPYRPGTTVGLSGLEQSYQATLSGTPTTTVVVQNAAGRRVKVLKTWPGTRGTPVRTTIDGRVQRAARGAVAGLPGSAAVVAVQASSGKILAVAQRQAGGMPAVDPLGGRYQPGQAFTIVSSAALLSNQPGYDVNTPVPCMRGFTLDGQLYSNVPAVSRLGKPQFSKVFAHACVTAFAQLSELLNRGELETATQQFGIGEPWRLPLRPTAFTGSIARPASQNEQAEDAVGHGTVQVSPLNMALAAGVVDSGSWHQPSIVTKPTGPTLTSGNKVPTRLKTTVVGQLRQMMADTVRSGAAQGAEVSGPALYGQVGSAPVAGHKGLHAIWFVGFRGDVAFAVLTFSRSASFAPAVQLAHHFAATLPRS
ncbi:MAG TPA: penicillin-binding transpeptidase domain-containing protein, partial [Streptosporangiaceae bacterium]